MDFNEEFIKFVDNDAETAENVIESKPWKILIVDDEKDVHRVTRIVLKGLTFEGRPIKLISAYSKEEALEILRKDKDIALAIIDVVMEDKHAGLDLVKYIRENLKNHKTRLVIRTGQPGYAPNKEVVLNYDINDYREKTELTSERLITVILSGLRSYRDIVNLEKEAESLKTIFGFATESTSETNEDIFLESSCKVVRNMAENYDIILNTKICEDYPEFHSNKKNFIHWENEKEFFVIFNSDTERQKVFCVSSEKPIPENLKNLLNLFLLHIITTVEKMRISNELNETLYEIIFTLGELLESRSEETGEHVLRVSNIVYDIAQAAGIEEHKAFEFKIASMLHDIGKIGIPDYILNKPGKLTDSEFEIMKEHTVIGYRILASSNKDIFKIAASIAKYHHENWDGSGYPEGLKGKEIPIEARITAIADVYDALISDRVYRPGWPKEKVIKYMKDMKGKKFDPELLDIFLSKIVDKF
ncbi:HD domain-containing phosphohydrolase [Marinitoga sp. 1135]|uniref:HD domain-containing phosphohydrolase n=1 Tax=Marinitoga sp. 1135 TaxID=1643333 RepID=UPI001585E9C2|nr:HD domain-containing phosphohydrolase [Marinitoga sp. 1135]